MRWNLQDGQSGAHGFSPPTPGSMTVMHRQFDHNSYHVFNSEI